MLKNAKDIERVQRSAIKIISGGKDVPYENILEHMGIDNLATRREQLCLGFAKNC